MRSLYTYSQNYLGRLMKAQNFKQEKEIMYFKENIKDTFEDELADTVIRILDLCGARGIDLEKHIYLKLKYKATRERMHGKNY